MRRGTPAAAAFGQLLYELRTKQGLTMREVGRRINAPAATVSQCEKGQRAVKEPKLDAWAGALGVSNVMLRAKWKRFQKEHPDGPIVRNTGKSATKRQLEELFNELTGPERACVTGYIHRLIEEREKMEG